MDGEVITPDILTKLIDTSPAPDEISKVNAYEGDENLLSVADKYVKVMGSIPRIKFRLEAWDFTLKFESMMNQLQPVSNSVARQ